MKTGFSLITAALIIFIAGCDQGPSPEDALRRFMQSTTQEDWGTFYDLLDNHSRTIFSAAMKKTIHWPELKMDKKTRDYITRLQGKEAVVYVMSNFPQVSAPTKVVSYDILEREILANMAYLTTRVKFSHHESTRKIKMVKEEGQWRVFLHSFTYEEKE